MAHQAVGACPRRPHEQRHAQAQAGVGVWGWRRPAAPAQQAAPPEPAPWGGRVVACDGDGGGLPPGGAVQALAQGQAQAGRLGWGGAVGRRACWYPEEPPRFFVPAPRAWPLTTTHPPYTHPSRYAATSVRPNWRHWRALVASRSSWRTGGGPGLGRGHHRSSRSLPLPLEPLAAAPAARQTAQPGKGWMCVCVCGRRGDRQPAACAACSGSRAAGRCVPPQAAMFLARTSSAHAHPRWPGPGGTEGTSWLQGKTWRCVTRGMGRLPATANAT